MPNDILIALETIADLIRKVDPIRDRAPYERLTAQLEDLRSIIAICSQNLPLVRT